MPFVIWTAKFVGTIAAAHLVHKSFDVSKARYHNYKASKTA